MTYITAGNLDEDELHKLLSLGDKLIITGDMSHPLTTWDNKTNSKNGTTLYDYLDRNDSRTKW